MKNSTLSRKPSHDMKPGVGAYGINPRAKSTSQSGDGADFAFNGQMGDGVNRASNPYAKNQHTGHSNDGRLVQMNQMPNRKGNDGACHHSGMPQGGKMPPPTAAGGKIDGGAVCKSPANPNQINMGLGPRKGNQ